MKLIDHAGNSKRYGQGPPTHLCKGRTTKAPIRRAISLAVSLSIMGWQNTKIKEEAHLEVLETTTLYNGMILFTFSINSRSLVFSFPRRSHNNGDVFLTYKFMINLLIDQCGILSQQSTTGGTKMDAANSSFISERELKGVYSAPNNLPKHRHLSHPRWSI